MAGTDAAPVVSKRDPSACTNQKRWASLMVFVRVATATLTQQDRISVTMTGRNKETSTREVFLLCAVQ